MVCMKKLRVYLDSTILITFVFGADKEADKFRDVERLFNSDKLKLVTSVYALIELYNFPIFNFKHNKRFIAKYGLLKVLLTSIEVAPLLTRETKIVHSREFDMKDKSDIPHAISAYVERCDNIVTFDSHFKTLNKIKSTAPAELLELF